MPSSWDVYYVVFLSAVLALGIPLFLAAISHLVSPGSASAPRTNTANSEQSSRNQTILGRRINARFFLGVNASLVLITLSLALIPCAGMIRPGTDHSALFRGLVAIVSIAGFAFLGLLYSARKGDLSWVTSFQSRPAEKASEERMEPHS